MRAHPLIAAAALVAAAACTRNLQRASGEVPPRSFEATSFPHSTHGGFDCDTCHEDVARWRKLGEYRAPGASKCAECHEKDAMHQPPAPRAPHEYDLRFSHADHLPRLAKKGDCGACHQKLPEPGDRSRTTPPMGTCTACHRHEADVMEARCTPCHVSLKRYAMKPLEQFTEFSHARNFVREHGLLARGSAETCAQCHDQTYCAPCHATATSPLRPEIRFPENVTSDFIHRGDYVARHALDVERDPARCRKCHGSAFCDSCHEQNRLTSRSSNPRDPHPRTGWVPRGPGFHGEAARQNVVACAGCHDQGAASVCVGCHVVGGPGGNPHPAGFVRRHERDDRAKNPTCRVCHDRR